MAPTTKPTLQKLGDTDLTVADPNEDVRGRTVLDAANEEIGHVDALMIDDQEYKVRFLQVAAGGFLGLGERKFLIPVDAITRIDADHVHVNQTRERVADAPGYDPNLATEPTYEPTYYEDLYGYYGYAPYWGPGYVYPAYPYYARY